MSEEKIASETHLNQSQVEESPTLQKKKPKKWLLISLVGALFLLLVGIGIWVWLAKPFSKEGPKSTSSQPSATSSAKTVDTKEKETKINRFVYTKGSDIYSMKVDGTDELKLASSYGPLRVSSDFNKVAFIKDRNLWAVGVNGVALEKLTTIGRDETDKFMQIDVDIIIGWSFGGTRILYSVNSNPSCRGDCPPGTKTLEKDQTVKEGVYIYDFNNKSNRFVTSRGLGSLEYVGWPKGQTNPIFVRESGQLMDESLYTLNTTDGSFIRFSNQKYPGLIASGDTSISSDGKFIAWTGAAHENLPNLSVPKDSSQIFVANIDGTNRKTISPIGAWADYYWPRYLPGDRFISFVKKLDREGDPRWSCLYDSLTGKFNYISTGRVFFYLDPATLLILRGEKHDDSSIYKFNIATGKENLLVTGVSELAL
ncbi:MAG: hypothetical protein A2113_00815 [Candidatus Woykebacteria bacterium GWA1_44_8]|uniref:Dipeptidylpeptidase IV N-terminal domain-containing protein n=1 Tax=Candidatus Woykebacteria bacterium GWA1_44_8 TaxID=1802591 RepID=A0A1G1W2P2_9BACT|nr:MAG: hypothetical protein A2113_00815 [Candidatus Woykebacteria bacterium GWA1_44_8]